MSKLNGPATYFFDIDGCICKTKSNDFVPGILETLKILQSAGHQIILTTKRGDCFKPTSIYGRKSTEELIEKLKENGVFITTILYNVNSNRILINDAGCHSVSRISNQEWTNDCVDKLLAAATK